MRIFGRLVCGAACLAFLGACATTGDASAGGAGGGGGVAGSSGTGGAGAGASARLTVEGPSTVALMSSQQAAITVRYVSEDDSPRPQASVNFTLVGSAKDSGLSQLTATTDAEGRATTTLLAGLQTASFQVRISAAGAQPVVVDAAVSDHGFGNLRVPAPYSGRRLVTQRRVAIFAGKTCEELDQTPGPDRLSNLTGSEAEARFIGLPAATSYAVLAVGFGAPAIALAQGCIDDITIEADLEVSASVQLSDLNLNPWGDYRVDAVLDTDEVALELAARVRDHAMSSAPGTTTTTAQRLLDALNDTLRLDSAASAQVAAADALALLRDPGTALVDLQAALDVAERGPMAAQAWLADQVDQELGTTTLSLDVLLDEGAGEPNIEWALLQAQTPSTLVQGGVINYVVEVPVSVAAIPAFAWSRDEMLAGGEMPSVFGALAVEVTDAAIDNTSASGRAEARSLLGCGELLAWVQQHTEVGDACDVACVEAACDLVLSTWLAGVQASLLAVDASRSVVSFSATFDLVDTSANAEVDVLRTAVLDAVWAADPLDEQDTPLAITGRASGSRLATTVSD